MAKSTTEIMRAQVEDSMARQAEWGTDNEILYKGVLPEGTSQDMRTWTDAEWDMLSSMDMEATRLDNYMK